MKVIYDMYEEINDEFKADPKLQKVAEAYLKGPGGDNLIRIDDCDENAMTPDCLELLERFVESYLEELLEHSSH